jgi:hypothetical protein
MPSKLENNSTRTIILPVKNKKASRIAPGGFGL